MNDKLTSTSSLAALSNESFKLFVKVIDCLIRNGFISLTICQLLIKKSQFPKHLQEHNVCASYKNICLSSPQV